MSSSPRLSIVASSLKPAPYPPDILARGSMITTIDRSAAVKRELSELEQLGRDEALEREIDVAREALVAATSASDRVIAAERMRALIYKRSSEQIRRMELAKGLA